MSVNDSTGDSGSTVSPPAPLALRHSANYMGCRHCEEGTYVYDHEAGASRCRACGKLD